MTNDPIQTVRNSLINSISQKYMELFQMILALPVQQNTVQIQKGLSYLDDGIVWIEKALALLPIDLKTPDIADGAKKPKDSKKSRKGKKAR